MQVETLTAHGEAYYGKIAVLPKEDQHHWIPQDGDLNRLKFYKKNEQENKWIIRRYKIDIEKSFSIDKRYIEN